MEKVKNILKLLCEKRSNQMWLFSRFLFIMCSVNLVIHAIVLAMIAVMPFAMWMLGNGVSGFLLWYFAPALAFVVWVQYEICAFVYEEYIDVDDGGTDEQY